jgi:hypothetical protein
MRAMLAGMAKRDLYERGRSWRVLDEVLGGMI